VTRFSAPTGRPVKLVSIVDEHTRECLGGLVERSITADRRIEELDRITDDRGYPAVLRCDNGPELACQAMADWAGERVGLAFIPASPGGTATSNPSTAGSATNASTSTCSGHSSTPASRSGTGRPSTTITAGI
jgi:hypothetical protein